MESVSNDIVGERENMVWFVNVPVLIVGFQAGGTHVLVFLG